jgi:hypothetical protein
MGTHFYKLQDQHQEFISRYDKKPFYAKFGILVKDTGEAKQRFSFSG